MSSDAILILSDDEPEETRAKILRTSDVSETLAQIDLEVEEIELEIGRLESRRAELESERSRVLESLDGTRTEKKRTEPLPPAEYYETKTDFEWSDELQTMGRQQFGLENFRKGQIGIMNATLSGRDVIVVMHTGVEAPLLQKDIQSVLHYQRLTFSANVLWVGYGKSLCYQLPAILPSSPGISLVVSPLLSLIHDQAFHLGEAGIGVGCIVGTTSKEETKYILDAMLSPENNAPDKPLLRLVYVTPEKIAKSKRFIAHLEKVHKAGRLARVCVDEAHCCSQLGHDFRPDYKKLGLLKTLFPNVPTMALTATCPPKVLRSVLSILGLATLDDPAGSLLFTGPLDRPNLRYSVVRKPPTAAATVQWIVDWIKKSHLGKSGIIYCLSKKDTVSIAEGIDKSSDGQIRAGVYHADMDETMKTRIHTAWRKGQIHVVVATIAFGMGINSPNVRFILHHSMSKSFDAYVQESGRAGRDGKPSECVLLYRSADASRLSTLAVTEMEGLSNVYDMMRYAEDVSTCRRVLFHRYFVRGASSQKHDGGEKCDNCDHCLNTDGAEVVNVDVRLQAATICKTLAACATSNEENGDRLTFLKTLDAWRGIGQKRNAVLKLVTEGEVEIPPPKRLSKDDQEHIVNHLLLNSYLKEDFHFTPYSTIAYLVLGARGRRLAEVSRKRLEESEEFKVEVLFRKINLEKGERKRKRER